MIQLNHTRYIVPFIQSNKQKVVEEWEELGRASKEIYLCLLLFLLLLSADASDYSFIASLAVALTLAPLSPRIKWPNDVLIHGKKISGILLETFNEKLIIGIGINIIGNPLHTLYPTTCLKECGIEVTSKVIFEKLLQNFSDLFLIYGKSGFKDIRRQWLEFAAGLGQKIEVHLPQKNLTGIFKNINEQGALLLETPEKEYSITAGDVFMI